MATLVAVISHIWCSHIILFRFTLFWERSILIIKEASARRIKVIEELEARGVAWTGRRRVTP